MGKRKNLELFNGLVTSFDAFNKSHTIDFGGANCPEAAEREMAAWEKIQERSEREFRDLHKNDKELLRLKLSANSTEKFVQESPSELSISFGTLINEYRENEKARAQNPDVKLKVSTLEEMLPKIRLFESYFSDRAVSSFSKKEIHEVCKWLQHLPSGYTKKGYSDLSAIEAAKSGHSLNTIGASTYNHYARQFRGIIKFAYDMDYLKENWSDMATTKDEKNSSSKTDKDPFTTQDLKRIFEAGSYAERVRYGLFRSKKATFEARYWLPILGLFTGARIEELCQLLVQDISKIGDNWWFDINEETAVDGSQKTAKTSNSIRKVPVHPKLIEIGFLDYVEQRKKALGGSSSLLNITHRADDSSFGSIYSKWFTNKSNAGTGGFIERCGIDSSFTRKGKKHSKSFHSFRHTLTDELRGKVLAQGVWIEDPDIAPITGHVSEDSHKLTTRRYGKGNDYLEKKYEVLSRAEYEGVVFPRWNQNMQC